MIFFIKKPRTVISDVGFLKTASDEAVTLEVLTAAQIREFLYKGGRLQMPHAKWECIWMRYPNIWLVCYGRNLARKTFRIRELRMSLWTACLLKPDDRIYDLVDVVDENAGAETKHDREIIVIDGRVYERVSRPGNEVHDAVDAVETGFRRIFS